jgi:hypothetical protein
MRLSVVHLRHHPRVFKQMMGLTVAEFEEVVYDLRPKLSRPRTAALLAACAAFRR